MRKVPPGRSLSDALRPHNQQNLPIRGTARKRSLAQSGLKENREASKTMRHLGVLGRSLSDALRPHNQQNLPIRGTARKRSLAQSGLKENREASKTMRHLGVLGR